jgi:hypothetical protein
LIVERPGVLDVDGQSGDGAALLFTYLSLQSGNESADEQHSDKSNAEKEMLAMSHILFLFGPLGAMFLCPV